MVQGIKKIGLKLGLGGPVNQRIRTDDEYISDNDNDNHNDNRNHHHRTLRGPVLPSFVAFV